MEAAEANTAVQYYVLKRGSALNKILRVEARSLRQTQVLVQTKEPEGVAVERLPLRARPGGWPQEGEGEVPVTTRAFNIYDSSED